MRRDDAVELIMDSPSTGDLRRCGALLTSGGPCALSADRK